MSKKLPYTGHPKVSDDREFLEITNDFTDPKDCIREAISNALDWGATEIYITVTEDRQRPEEEMVIEITDNGIGLDKTRLKAFFDLGNSTTREAKEDSTSKFKKIGYKGHGTKTYFNSRSIDLNSSSRNCEIVAIMDKPLHNLMQGKVPTYEYDIEEVKNKTTGTKIKIFNYNMSTNKADFGHKVIKDYILWFTKFGSIDREFDIRIHEDKVLYLQGLGRNDYEEIKFGHVFPKENDKISKLQKKRPGDWTNEFVKKWIFKDCQVLRNPGKKIDMVFYIEGDEAKRSYNVMLRRQFKTLEHGMYKVEDRYGLWVCKDFIPIKKYNEWLGLGQRLETKYHAFVNCPDFRLTANRGDIGNTPPGLLKAIEETVHEIYINDIQGSPEYQEYDAGLALEKQYANAKQEGKDFTRRSKIAKKKKICKFKGTDLIEPRVEMGVVALFNLVYAHKPKLFPFNIVDYDTKKGYDALVVHGSPFDLSKESMSFVEFKYILKSDFNHSFSHLIAIVCWDCNLADGDKVWDIEKKYRTLYISPDDNNPKITRYMLVNPKEKHNIEVFVLQKYLKETCNIEFAPRQTTKKK